MTRLADACREYLKKTKDTTPALEFVSATKVLLSQTASCVGCGASGAGPDAKEWQFGAIMDYQFGQTFELLSDSKWSTFPVVNSKFKACPTCAHAVAVVTGGVLNDDPSWEAVMIVPESWRFLLQACNKA